jgi:hypothetical protein
MNSFPNNDAANNPAPAASDRAYPRAPAANPLTSNSPSTSGMKSNLKIAIPVVALVAVIFGITFFAQYTPPTDDPSKVVIGTGKEPPLRFFSAARAWDPPSFPLPSKELPRDYRGLPLLAPTAVPREEGFLFNFSVQDRVFPGFYEIQSDAVGPKHGASFWFENPNAMSVTMQLAYVSCSACSGAKLAMIPPDATRQFLQMSRVSILPQGLFNGLPVGMVGPAANLAEPHVRWEQHVFKDNLQAQFKIPPANNPDGWTPQWGILELQFSLYKVEAKPLRADFQTVIDGTQEIETNKFMILANGANPFDLTTDKIDLGELSEKSEPRKFDIIAYSATRGPMRIGAGEPGDLLPPTPTVQMPSAQGGEPGPFITITPPVRVPESELGYIASQIAERSQQKQFARVESAYRYTVTLSPKVGDSSIDIGLLEREIWFRLPNADARVLNVKGLVTGVVWLDDNLHEITMPESKFFDGYTKEYRLITARRDLTVELLKDQWRPAFLQVELTKDPKPATADRGYYILKVRVPSSKENNTIKAGTYTGEIVLDVKGTTTQRIRFPVKGRIEPR